ncbi:hypothetical protein ACLF3G_18620 [Falsiroseomonas sp. HC035]|uniref:hypothetical protein n=1 Tax=Falsiroseomonas sp. HC035 TaxID=3390999 RepID=UPI003D322CE4
MGALDAIQAICRLVPRPRPRPQGGPGAGLGEAAPTELVDGRWQVIGVTAPAGVARRASQVVAPVAAGAAAASGMILACEALGLPSLLSGPHAAQPAPTAGAESAGVPFGLAAEGETLGLLMSGPSLFRLGGLFQDQLPLVGELHPPLETVLVPVPEPDSIVLFAGFLVLFTGVLLRPAARRRRLFGLPAARR